MTINFAPLLDPVSDSELREFRQESIRRREPWASLQPRTLVIGGILLGAVLLYAVIIAAVAEADPVVIVGVVVAIVVSAAGVALWWLLWPGRWRRMLRAQRFARANGLVFLVEGSAPTYPGIIFGVGDHRRTHNVLRRFDPWLDMGTYRYTTGQGRYRATYRWQYVACRLPRKVPHLLLDAKGNNTLFGRSGFPVTLAPGQTLSLEGDFDRHFTLHCPQGYERDALYIFTPDLMALLIDESGTFDVEFVDDWMFLYRRGRLDVTDPHTLQRVFQILDTVGQRVLRRTKRYADDTIGNRHINTVAPKGQRLKKKSVATVIIVLAALWVASLTMVFLLSSFD